MMIFICRWILIFSVEYVYTTRHYISTYFFFLLFCFYSYSPQISYNNPILLLLWIYTYYKHIFCVCCRYWIARFYRCRFTESRRTCRFFFSFFLLSLVRVLFDSSSLCRCDCAVGIFSESFRSIHIIYIICLCIRVHNIIPPVLYITFERARMRSWHSFECRFRCRSVYCVNRYYDYGCIFCIYYIYEYTDTVQAY